MTILGEAFVVIRPDLNKFRPELQTDLAASGKQGAQSFGRSFETEAERTARAAGQKTATSFGRSLGAGLIGVGVGAIIKRQLQAGFTELVDLDKQLFQTEARLRSTGGAANVTAEHVRELSISVESLTGIDEAAVLAGENLLLTFTRIRNEVGEGNQIFDRATLAATDLSVALGSDLSAAALQVGKALNDPIKGVTALGRAGVQFTAEQKEMIKTLVESGQVLEAQKIILAELETQVGGSAEAFGASLGGEAAKVIDIFTDLRREVVAGTIPTLTGFGDIAKIVGSVLGGIGPPVIGLVTAIAGLGIALKAAQIAASGFGIALPIGPIGAAITAITLLATAVGLGKQQIADTRAAVQSLDLALRSLDATAINEAMREFEERARGIADVDFGDTLVEPFADLLPFADGASEALTRMVEAIDASASKAKDQEGAMRSVTLASADYKRATLELILAQQDAGSEAERLGLKVLGVADAEDNQTRASEALDLALFNLKAAHEGTAEAASAEAAAHRENAEAARAERLEKLQLAGGFLAIQGAVLSAGDAQRSYQEAQAEVTRLVAEGKKGTDEYRDAIQSQRGAQLNAIESQLGIAEAVQKYIDEIAKGKSTQEAAIELTHAAGLSAGFTERAVNQLTDGIRGTVNAWRSWPAAKETKVTAPGLVTVESGLKRLLDTARDLDRLNTIQIEVAIVKRLTGPNAPTGSSALDAALGNLDAFAPTGEVTTLGLEGIATTAAFVPPGFGEERQATERDKDIFVEAETGISYDLFKRIEREFNARLKPVLRKLLERQVADRPTRQLETARGNLKERLAGRKPDEMPLLRWFAFHFAIDFLTAVIQRRARFREEAKPIIDIVREAFPERPPTEEELAERAAGNGAHTGGGRSAPVSAEVVDTGGRGRGRDRRGDVIIVFQKEVITENGPAFAGMVRRVLREEIGRGGR